MVSKILLSLVTLVASTAVFAQEVAASSTGITDAGVKAIAAALAVSLAALGCGLGQGKAAGAAYDAIARNPAAYDKIFTPMIIGLALIESIAIYGLVVALLIK
jgi:F-type H+-transporting ATPase subunit c